MGYFLFLFGVCLFHHEKLVIKIVFHLQSLSNYDWNASTHWKPLLTMFMPFCCIINIIASIILITAWFATLWLTYLPETCLWLTLLKEVKCQDGTKMTRLISAVDVNIASMIPHQPTMPHLTLWNHAISDFTSCRLKHGMKKIERNII